MSSNQSKVLSKGEYITSIAIIGALFFIFGFVTWLNATLIPFLQISCELTKFEAYLVTFSFYISYFVMALPSSWILHKTGFKGGMAFGLIVMAAGSLIFIPAALTRTFSLFLTGLFVQGTGLAIIQTASNPYVTILGPLESAAKRISIMGICNKIAGVISPLILGAIILKNIDSLKAKLVIVANHSEQTAILNELASRVIFPYVIMAVALVLLAAMVRYSPLPDIGDESNDAKADKLIDNRTSIFQFPYLLLGFIAIFLCTGLEVVAGDTIILYGQYQGVALSHAKYFASFTLTAMVLGYIFGIITIPRILKQDKALMLSACIGFITLIAAITTSGLHIKADINIHLLGFSQVLPFELSVVFLALLGFATAFMWPAIWPLAIDGLGKFTKTGSAILIMGIAGAATLPLLYRYLADFHSIGDANAYWLLAPCYVFIFYYATKGHKLGKIQTI